MLVTNDRAVTRASHLGWVQIVLPGQLGIGLGGMLGLIIAVSSETFKQSESGPGRRGPVQVFAGQHTKNPKVSGPTERSSPDGRFPPTRSQRCD